jgi:hypothetical protein
MLIGVLILGIALLIAGAVGSFAISAQYGSQEPYVVYCTLCGMMAIPDSAWRDRSFTRDSATLQHNCPNNFIAHYRRRSLSYATSRAIHSSRQDLFRFLLDDYVKQWDIQRLQVLIQGVIPNHTLRASILEIISIVSKLKATVAENRNPASMQINVSVVLPAIDHIMGYLADYLPTLMTVEDPHRSGSGSIPRHLEQDHLRIRGIATLLYQYQAHVEATARGSIDPNPLRVAEALLKAVMNAELGVSTKSDADVVPNRTLGGTKFAQEGSSVTELRGHS